MSKFQMFLGYFEDYTAKQDMNVPVTNSLFDPDTSE